MKILVVHRYFWPNVPAYALMLKKMTLKLAAQGHDVTMFSTQPCYNDIHQGPPLPRVEMMDDVKVIRTPLFKEKKSGLILRAVNILRFCTSMLAHAILRRDKYDVVMVASFPPTVMAACARVIQRLRGTRYVYHCQDIYPEVALASGLVKRAWLAKLAGWIDRQNIRKATVVVVLSQDMKKTLMDRGLSGNNIHLINNFVIDRLDAEVSIPTSLAKPAGSFRVLFAGNLGRFQNLETVVDAAKQLESVSQIRFDFVGGGVMKDKLKERSGSALNKSIFFHDHQSLSVAMRVIHESDLAIVSLSPGVIFCAYPSKTMSYLESGCRIMAIVEGESEFGKMIVDFDCGIVCPSGDANVIANQVRQEFERFSGEGYSRHEIRELGQSSFGKEKILSKWADLFRTLE